jgi:hypothetical protein
MPLIDITEMSPFPRNEVPFSLDLDGPTLGVLNIDAAIDYSKENAPLPERASNHPAALALFDVMKSMALRCSMILNEKFLE